MKNKDVLDWLNAAEIDTRSARVLLRESLYSAAVFHTQQAYEKTYKAYWAFIKHEPELLRKFRHLNIDKKMFDNIHKDSNEQSQLLSKFGMRSFEDYKKVVKALVLADENVYASVLPFFTGLIQNDERKENEVVQLRNSYEAIFSKRGTEGFGSLMMTFAGIRMVAPLVSAHFVFVRYPDKEIKPTDYNEKMGMVRVLPELLSLVEYGINKLKRYA